MRLGTNIKCRCESFEMFQRLWHHNFPGVLKVEYFLAEKYLKKSGYVGCKKGVEYKVYICEQCVCRLRSVTPSSTTTSLTAKPLGASLSSPSTRKTSQGVISPLALNQIQLYPSNKGLRYCKSQKDFLSGFPQTHCHRLMELSNSAKISTFLSTSSK